MIFHRLVVLFVLTANGSVSFAKRSSRRLREARLESGEELDVTFDILPIAMSLPLMPSAVPSDTPSLLPSISPFVVPTSSPTNEPTMPPLPAPSLEPTPAPTPPPTDLTTPSPTVSPPTMSPTVRVTSMPTEQPTSSLVPTALPVQIATASPTSQPSPRPTAVPTNAPTLRCNITESERAASLSILVKSISTASEVDTPGTPQNLASDWLINSDPLYVCPDDPRVTQRYVMGVFYFSTRGNRWRSCNAPTDFGDPAAIDAANEGCIIALPEGGSDAWLTPGDECNWGGLLCDEQNLISRIDFEQNGIAGTLPSEIQELSALRFLVLEEGVLTGTIPTEIGNLVNLEQIDLNFNLLSGPIPEELFNLSNLQQLDLNDNELQGSISTAIAQLTRLSFLQIENNKITGTVPSQLGSLLLLEVASMYNNVMSGSMPQNVCDNVYPSGLLEVLVVDCQGAPSRPSPPLVTCECCTGCL